VTASDGRRQVHDQPTVLSPSVMSSVDSVTRCDCTCRLAPVRRWRTRSALPSPHRSASQPCRFRHCGVARHPVAPLDHGLGEPGCGQQRLAPDVPDALVPRGRRRRPGSVAWTNRSTVAPSPGSDHRQPPTVQPRWGDRLGLRPGDEPTRARFPSSPTETGNVKPLSYHAATTPSEGCPHWSALLWDCSAWVTTVGPRRALTGPPSGRADSVRKCSHPRNRGEMLDPYGAHVEPSWSRKELH
jgi:hypothetical protein